MASNEISEREYGEIITFYSYKSGTGRTMALSNVACILAKRSPRKRVLMVDWDLEAPGLYRFFFQEKYVSPSIIQEIASRAGLIDLFIELDQITRKSDLKEDFEISYEALNSINIKNFIVSTHIPNLYMIKAGQDPDLDKKYFDKVTSFKWEQFYFRSPSLIRLFTDKLAESYDYVLIDSRTGYTDVGGLSTMLMPQKLVVVFTPNRQSYPGIKELILRATKYRKKSTDLRPLVVYPLPSRIEFALDDLRKYWRIGNDEKGILGYKPMFEELFKDVYELDDCDLYGYFEQVQIQQSPNYAYGEDIAVMEEKTTDRFSLTDSYKIFVEWLIGSEAPWQKTQLSRIEEFKLLRSLKGHSSTVTDVVVTSDNSKIVSGSGDKTIKVWDMNNGELLKTLEGHSSTVASVIVTSDNSKIISGSQDETIKVWDMNTGELLKTLEGHSSAIQSVAVTSDNSKIVSGAWDNMIKIWDMNTGKLLNTLVGHSNPVTSVAVTSDNRKVVSGAWDNMIKIWDMNTGKLLNTLVGHSNPVNSVAVTSDNSKIVSGSGDKTIKVWDFSGKCYSTETFDTVILSISLSKNNDLIVLGGQNGNLYLGTFSILLEDL